MTVYGTCTQCEAQCTATYRDSAPFEEWKLTCPRCRINVPVTLGNADCGYSIFDKNSEKYKRPILRGAPEGDYAIQQRQRVITHLTNIQRFLQDCGTAIPRDWLNTLHVLRSDNTRILEELKS